MEAVYDTNILIDYLNGFDQAAKELALNPTRIISIITLIEILVGAKNADEEGAVRGFLSSFTVREVTPEVAESAVELRKNYRLRIPDAIIYATARTEDCLLVSRNTKDLKSSWPDIRVSYEL